MKNFDQRTARSLLLLLAVLSVAAALRFAHLDWGLPAVEEEAFPSKVAINMWGFDDGTPDLDPGTAGWPALSFYVQRAAQQFHYLAGRISGSFDGPLDYYVAWLLDPSAVILLGRLTSVLCGLLVCFVAFRMGHTIAGTGGAILAAGLCAISPLLVLHSQFVEPDALVVAFSALALLWCLRIAGGGRVSDYALAGLWIGLGTASKYTPALMSLSIYLVHLERRRTEGKSNRYLGLDDRRLGWAALVALLSFNLASPFTLANLGVLKRDFAYQALHMSSGHFGHAQQGVGYAHYLLDVLPKALGWPAMLAGLAGLALAARGPATGRVALWGLLPYLIVLGSLSTHFDRYMLPAVLPLALGCASLLAWLRVRSGGRRWPVVALVLLALAFPARASLRQSELQGTPSTLQLSADWLAEHMDADAEVLVSERYGPILPRDQRELLQTDPAFARMSAQQQQRLLDRPFYHVLDIPMYSVRTELAAYYYDLRHFLGYDWMVISGSVRNRYLAEPSRFTRQTRFYELLDEIATPQWSVRPEGAIRGPAQQVYRIDDAFRLAVLEELGPLPVGDYASFASSVHRPHFIGFVHSIAAHAELRQRHREAAFWYRILTNTAEDPAMRALGYERAGVNDLRDGQLVAAREMFNALTRFPERELVALGNLGLICEREGDIDSARRYYEEVSSRDVRGEAGTWARQRLAALQASEEQ